VTHCLGEIRTLYDVLMEISNNLGQAEYRAAGDGGGCVDEGGRATGSNPETT